MPLQSRKRAILFLFKVKEKKKGFVLHNYPDSAEIDPLLSIDQFVDHR